MTRTFAQTPHASACTKECRSLQERIAAVAREVFPTKTVPNLMAEFGVSERTANHIVTGQYVPNGRTIAAMLASKYGFQFLKGFIGDAAHPEWLGRQERAQRIADLEDQLAQLHRDIESFREGRSG